MINMLFLARMAPYKGLPDLLHACVLLRREDWHLTIIGGRHPQEAEEVDYLIDRLSTVRSLPPVANVHVPMFMRAADIVVIPSRYENFCNVALESMASSRAVIGSRCGGIPDLIIDRWNGLLFPPGDKESLASAITTILDQPSKVQMFGKRGREAAERFSWAAVTQQTIQLLESLPTN